MTEDKEVVKKTIITFLPSIKQLFRVLKSQGIYIDSRSVTLKTILQKAYILKNKYNFTTKQTLNYFLPKKQTLKRGLTIFCEEYGKGKITNIYDNNLFEVKFINRRYEIMCDSKSLIAVHNNSKIKLYIVD